MMLVRMTGIVVCVVVICVQVVDTVLPVNGVIVKDMYRYDRRIENIEHFNEL